jgi:hypothetical protein
MVLIYEERGRRGNGKKNLSVLCEKFSFSPQNLSKSSQIEINC